MWDSNLKKITVFFIKITIFLFAAMIARDFIYNGTDAFNLRNLLYLLLVFAGEFFISSKLKK